MLSYPPYSPDLNSIENLWAVLVRQWKAIRPKTKVNYSKRKMRRAERPKMFPAMHVRQQLGVASML
jgi:transposase